MAKVSVIVPVYGVEAYIGRCAKSLFEQTLDDIEYIFINDCTPDNSVDILKSVLDDYPERRAQTRIIDMPQNSGQAAVRECGMKLVTGEYVIHCDSDDWVDVNMYEILYNTAKEGDLDIVWCDYYNTDGNKKEHIKLSKQPRLMQGPVWNKLVRTSLLANEIIFPTCNKAEDGALMTQISFYAKSRGYIDQPLYFYYQNEDSICRQSGEYACLNRLNQEIDNTNLKIRFLEQHNALNDYANEVIEWKYTTRHNLYPIMYKRKYRKLWRNTYKEINWQYLLSQHSINSKIWFIVVYTGLYHMLKR